MTTAMVSITITPIVPVSIFYSPDSARCLRNRSCLLPAPTVIGGAPASYAVSPTLPVGLVISNSGAISGTPTVLSANTPYVVTGTNSLGTVTATVRFEVVPEPPNTVTYTPNKVTCTRSLPCNIGAPTYLGDPATNFSLGTSLPPGMTLDGVTGVISGTPTAGNDPRSIYIYVYNAGGGEYGIFELTVVDFPPTNLAYSPNSIVCALNNVCSLGAPTSSGGAITRYSIEPALPNGMYIEQSTGIFRGQPYQLSAITTYTVTGANTGGSTTTTVNVSVELQPPSNLRFAPALGCFKAQYCQSIFSYDGSPPNTVTFSPPLPSWLNTSGNYLYGTPPAAQGPTRYTATASNAAGSTTGTLSVAVFEPSVPAAIDATVSMSLFGGIGIHPTNPLVMYARTVTDDVFGTTNGGTSWKRLCHARGAGGSSYGNVLVSPTGVAFTNNSNSVDRIIDADGGPCFQLPREMYYAGDNDSWFGFTSTGRIYHWGYQNGLASSDDNGTTFTAIGGLNSYFRSIAVDPFNETRVVSVHSPTGSSPTGIISGLGQTLNAGFTDYSNGPIFNPKYRGYIHMRISGTYSVDDGATWASGAGFAVMAFDGSGAGYRLEYVLGVPSLTKAADLRTAPVWVALKALPSQPMNSSIDTVKVTSSGAGIILMTNNRVYFSTDSGLTLTPLSVELSLNGQAATSVAASGSTVYASMGYAVARSTDNGATWAASGLIDVTANTIRTSRLVPSLQNPNHAYLRGESYTGGTYSPEMVHTNDGFQTFTIKYDTNQGWYSWSSAFALSPVDDTLAFALGYQGASKTVDSGATWVKSSVSDMPSGWSAWRPGDATVSPWNPALVYYSRGPYSNEKGELWAYSDTTHTNANLSLATGLQEPTGLNVYKPTASTYAMRVINVNGKVSETLDGTTYTQINTTGGLDTTSLARLIRTSTTDPTLVVTVNIRSPELSVSYDSGASWFRLQMQQCNNITDVAVTSNRAFVSCYNQKPQVLTLR